MILVLLLASLATAEICADKTVDVECTGLLADCCTWDGSTCSDNAGSGATCDTVHGTNCAQVAADVTTCTDACLEITGTVTNAQGAGDDTCTPPTHQCADGEGACVDVDCAQVAADVTTCTDACLEITGTVTNAQGVGDDTCTPPTHQCADGEGACVDVDCVEVPADPATCTDACLEITGSVTNAQGIGSTDCTAPTHQCVDGEGSCLAVACVKGADLDPSTQCTAACEELIRQDVAAIGGGAACDATGATHQCVGTEGACVASDCAAVQPDAGTCTAECLEITGTVTPAVGGGDDSCEAPTHQCVGGEGLCVAVDCVKGADLDPSTQCTVACEELTRQDVAAIGGGAACDAAGATHQCVGGEGACVASPDDDNPCAEFDDDADACAGVENSCCAYDTDASECNFNDDADATVCADYDDACHDVEALDNGKTCAAQYAEFEANPAIDDMTSCDDIPANYQALFKEKCPDTCGLCPEDDDVDCVMGDAVTAADCTADCGTVTQTVTTAASGNGEVCPEAGTYECQAGDGACPASTDGGNGGTDSSAGLASLVLALASAAFML